MWGDYFCAWTWNSTSVAAFGHKTGLNQAAGANIYRLQKPINISSYCVSELLGSAKKVNVNFQDTDGWVLSNSSHVLITSCVFPFIRPGFASCLSHWFELFIRPHFLHSPCHPLSSPVLFLTSIMHSSFSPLPFFQSHNKLYYRGSFASVSIVLNNEGFFQKYKLERCVYVCVATWLCEHLFLSCRLKPTKEQQTKISNCSSHPCSHNIMGQIKDR